jgi:excisionase family DNA binding protein
LVAWNALYVNTKHFVPNGLETKSGERETYATKKEMAAHLRVTERTVENWMVKGLPYYRLGSRRTRFKLSEVDAWLADKCRIGRRL